jgi:hypothetical protein
LSVNSAILSDAAWTGAVFARDLPGLGRDDAEEKADPARDRLPLRQQDDVDDPCAPAGDAAGEKSHPGSAAYPG